MIEGLTFEELIKYLEQNPTYYQDKYDGDYYTALLRDLNTAYMSSYSQVEQDEWPDSVRTAIIESAGKSAMDLASKWGIGQGWDGDIRKVSVSSVTEPVAGDGNGADPVAGDGNGDGNGGEVATDTPDWGFLEKPSSRMYGFEDEKPGQYQQFLGGLGGIEGYGGLTRGGQQWMQNQFDPLAAGYALQTALAPFQGTSQTTPMMGAAGGFDYGVPSTPVSFAEYMQTGGPFRGGTGAAFPAIGGEGGYLPGAPGGFRPSQQQFEQAFKAMTPLYGRPDFEEWVSNVSPVTGNPDFTANQRAALKWMGGDRNIAQNLITQYGMGQVAPMFQNQVSSMLEPAFAEFYTRPEAQTAGGLFGEFLRSGIGGLGGWANAGG